ncbi:MAG TPA: DUF2071 domain-containing protein [Chthoniobacterales bacterium]
MRPTGGSKTGQTMEPWAEAQLRERVYPSAGRLAMRQRWRDLLFLHWRWNAAEVQGTLPAGLTVDTWDGSAWIGIVPFAMRGVRPRFTPSIPVVSNFLELNLRTYVRDAQGRPGVWFYSLDASQPLAVWAARALFALPYFGARMECRIEAGEFRFRSRRHGNRAALDYRYRPVGKGREAVPGSLDFFLVERYRLFAWRASRLLTGRVYHPPYHIASVTLAAWDDALFAMDGFRPPGSRPDHQAYSPGVDVSIFPMELVR